MKNLRKNLGVEKDLLIVSSIYFSLADLSWMFCVSIVEEAVFVDWSKHFTQADAYIISILVMNV